MDTIEKPEKGQGKRHKSSRKKREETKEATSGQEEYQVESLTWIEATCERWQTSRGLMVVVTEKEAWVVGRHGLTLIYVAPLLRTSGRHLNWAPRL